MLPMRVRVCHTETRGSPRRVVAQAQNNRLSTMRRETQMKYSLEQLTDAFIKHIEYHHGSIIHAVVEETDSHFTCPSCGGHGFGSDTAKDPFVRHCNGRGCSFSWSAEFDDQFLRKAEKPSIAAKYFQDLPAGSVFVWRFGDMVKVKSQALMGRKPGLPTCGAGSSFNAVGLADGDVYHVAPEELVILCPPQSK